MKIILTMNNQISSKLILNVNQQIMLDPSWHVATNPLQQNVCGEGQDKMGFYKVLIQLTVFNEDKRMGKSINFKSINNNATRAHFSAPSVFNVIIQSSNMHFKMM